MSRSLKYLGGGLLSGIGEGMISEAAGVAKRKAALDKLRGEMARDDLKHQRTLERDDKKHERDQGMLHTTVTEEGGKVTGITKGGQTVDTGAIEDVSASGKDPARVREAQWLVDNKIFPDLNAAYNATRTRVGMDPATVRVKALTWVSAQKDKYGRQKYTKPEEIAAGVQAYQKFIDGDTAGALEAFKSIEPKAAEDEAGFLQGMWRSLTGVIDVEDEGEADSSQTSGAQRLNPGEFVQNGDGSRSTERTITVTDQRINNGRPTNIPSIWSVNGKTVELPFTEEGQSRAIEYALGTGESWQSFDSIEAAEQAARSRSDAGGRFSDAGKGDAAKGQGSQENPYRPTTQADFDAIPSGAIYINPADGRPYRKK